MPWDELLDAQSAAMEAARGDDAQAQAAALQRLRDAQEHCGVVGGLLILMAMEHAGYAVQKKLATVFGQLGIGAYQKAQTAEARASWALSELDALRQQVKEIQKRLDERTPGIGEPGRGRQAG